MAPDLPPHLARYVVAQDYAAYTPRDQAVWRHILRRLTAQLEPLAHPGFLPGLAAVGIDGERIPSLEAMNGRLAALGWRAVAVRGFIPPAVFTELQACGILAIAEDIRSHAHIDYTPAPDIVHESAGHAPFLAVPRYAEYLRRCGVVGFKAIASREDQAVFAAIRHLSVVKEDPEAGPEEQAEAEAALSAALAARTFVSESTRASRLYWWTAEYGLVGSLESPRIYGAGLLSSLGESARCLGPGVRRLPLSLACVAQDYDITTMQPQLYVARDFEQLFEVLAEFEATLAWRRGGDHGLETALRAGTVNHLLLPGGWELSGVVRRLHAGPREGTRMATRLAELAGPVLPSRAGRATGETWLEPALVAFGAPDPGLIPGQPFRLVGEGGLVLEGTALSEDRVTGLAGTLAGQPLDLPASAHLVTAGGLPGVAGGPADPEAWDRLLGGADPLAEGDAERLARLHKAAALPEPLAELYRGVEALRQRRDPAELARLRRAAEAYPDEWLLAEELAELARHPGAPSGAAPGGHPRSEP